MNCYSNLHIFLCRASFYSSVSRWISTKVWCYYCEHVYEKLTVEPMLLLARNMHNLSGTPPDQYVYIYIQCMLPLCRQLESECMGVQFLCQPSEDKEWYYHWQKARLRWWKRVSFFSSPSSISDCLCIEYIHDIVYVTVLNSSLLILPPTHPPVYNRHNFSAVYFLILQLAVNPENFSLVDSPTSELPDHTLQESVIKVSCYTLSPQNCEVVTLLLFSQYNFPCGAAVVEHLSNRGDSQFLMADGETQAHLKVGFLYNHTKWFAHLLRFLFQIAKGDNGKTYPHLLSLSANVDRGKQ